MPAGILEARTAAALEPLVGLPIWHTSRASTLISLQIGAYAIHLQCPWRLSAASGIVTGSADVFVPADDTVTEAELDQIQPGRMLVDVALRDWRAAHETRPLCVRTVRVDRFGGFVLELDGDFALEVFLDGCSTSHDPSEQWRLFQPGKEGVDHFVMLSSGIE